MPLHVGTGRCRGKPRRRSPHRHPFASEAIDETEPKEMLSAHAFDVLSRARNEIEVCHTAESHRFKFFVITNAHGKRILSESVEVVAKEGATHTPEFFSGSARAFAITVAHRSHVID